ncbi:MAG: N4-gp56 family major capsid protein [Ruminococcaceae bacterium]|nr:N4-gp56 family major capsid protein [Oscillospiraceae bacterium]
MTNFKLNLQLFAAGDVVNATTSTELSGEMKTFYDKTLITLASPYLVHDQFGQKRDIPKNGGKIIEFRKFSSLPKALTPLTEGVTPSGNKLNVSAISATVEQYGDYIEQTDLLELTAVDNTIVEATKQLASQAGLTMDTIVRNELVGGTNVMYCPKVADGAETIVTLRSEIDKTALLRVKDVFKAAAELKAMNAPKIDGYYVGIIHPYVAYDLMQEAGNQWMEVQKYTTPENMLNGEIGCLGGVRFVESTEAKIWQEGKENSAVFATLILGADAYGVTSVTGGGIEHIVKQKGYGNDPLNQRSSIGWKGLKTAKRLVEEYMVRIESGSTFSGSAKTN